MTSHPLLNEDDNYCLQLSMNFAMPDGRILVKFYSVSGDTVAQNELTSETQLFTTDVPKSVEFNIEIIVARSPGINSFWEITHIDLFDCPGLFE